MKPVRLVLEGQATFGTWLLGHGSGVRPLAVLCLLAALAGLAAVAWQISETRQQVRSAQKALDALREQRGQIARQATPATRPALTVQQSRDWNQLVRQLNTPWPAILDALEATTPETVALVAIEPDPQHGGVRLQAEAKTLDTLLGYVESLRAAGPFQEVILVKHETNEHDATRPVRLSLDARMKSPVPFRPHRAGVAQ